MSQFQKGKTNLDFTEARDSEWRWHQLGHMQVCTSLRTDNHASTPPLSFFTGRMPFLPPNQQRQSTKGVSVVDDEHTAAGYLCGSDGSWHRASRCSSAPPWRTGYSACTANTAGRSWPGPRRSCPPRTARRRCRRAGRTAARRRPRAGRPCSGGRRVVDGRRLRTPRGHPRRSSSDAAGDRSPADSDLSSAECGVLAARYMVTTTGPIHATTVNQPTNRPINLSLIHI